MEVLDGMLCISQTVGNAAYDRRVTQYESLWNSHHLRSNGIVVNDVAKDKGGDQCIYLNDGKRDITIPLEFNGDIMTVELFEPTKDELLTLKVNWLTPPIEELTLQLIRRRRGDVENQQSDRDENLTEELRIDDSSDTPLTGKGYRSIDEWKALLSFPSDNVVEKTLTSTTQLQVEPVELDRREIPRQHRKKRLLMLHPRRLRG